MGILVVVLLIILLPVIKTGYKLWKSVREIKKAYREQYAQQGGASRRGREDYNQPQRHKKAIDPSVGEYVEFEEIREDRHVEASADTTCAGVEDELVEDAEFEEIVDK